MPRALEMIDATVRQLERGELSPLEAIEGLLARRPRLVVAEALANKMARVIWAVMAKGQSYRQAAPA